MESARTRNDLLTPSQRQAVAARGNVLVMAGAGTGKTHTLVERCLDCLCRERVSLDEILVVTFTEAAATEMKRRLRVALGTALDSRHSTLGQHLAEQLALFDTAHIGTLHSFCLRLVREHFYELGLDPQLAVLDEGETRLLMEETFDGQFRSHYAGQTDFSVAVQNLIQIYGNGDERPIRAMVLRLHHYAQTRPDAERWLAEQLVRFASPEPVEWREWLLNAIGDWREEWLPVLDGLKGENEKAAECLDILQKWSKDSLHEQAATVLENTLMADNNYPTRKKTVLREPLRDFFADASFLRSIVVIESGCDPLADDWGWIRDHMITLLRLAREFEEKFAVRKRTDSVLDFHDLEQFALRLLWDFTANKPTAVAERWRQKIRFVFVDEYQDINAAQDEIIQALSREGGDANRFLVGDVKQSIYRFRLADPKIFRDYANEWRGENGQVIPLAENFRSRESLLGFVNSLFELLIREEVGGVNYDAEARLQFGLPERRATLSLAQNPSPRAELLLHIKNGRNDDGPVEESDKHDLAGLEAAEKEARLVARRLKELFAEGHEIWDEKKSANRPVQWQDMAVLLRAPSGKSEAYAKEFERAGVPLLVERGGFYDSTEIADLLSLLKLLDNPLQDVPTIAVLRSPLVGLSLDELAVIRLAAKEVHFWTALNRGPKAEGRRSKELDRKIEQFLERFSRWRQLARQASLSQCLENVLAETHYAEWLRSRPRGAQRQANVARFLSLAQRFDQFQRQGLFRFLKFIEAQQAVETEPEVASATGENAVRLMSIHQSKGQEFPVVVAADLAKAFNEQDLRGEIIFDEQFGLCPRVKPPPTGRRYPSLPYWLAQKHQRREQRGEELRLLYVVLTRARDTLILAVTISEPKWKSLWQKPNAIAVQAIVSAKSYADWLGMWFRIQNSTKGELPHLRWRTVQDTELGDDSVSWHRGDGIAVTDQSEIPHVVAGKGVAELDSATAKRLCTMLSWNYPFDAATRRAAKSSVTALRRQAEELDNEAEPMFQPFRHVGSDSQSAIRSPQLTAAATGTAHHKFLQHVALERADDLTGLQAEAERLETTSVLTADERAALDLTAVAAFWKSGPGRKIRAQPEDCIKRELPFTVKLSPAAVDAMVGAKTPAGLENEFVVVQGVADLVVLLPKEIWLVDFKTDGIRPGELKARRRLYEPQLKLYASALARIYSRPVTHCWLHFLAIQQTTEVNLQSVPEAKP